MIKPGSTTVWIGPWTEYDDSTSSRVDLDTVNISTSCFRTSEGPAASPRREGCRSSIADGPRRPIQALHRSANLSVDCHFSEGN